jgi:tRNA uridine 5-carbamoylmethylation protein Kti12
MRVFMPRGLPASGKTTWAKQYVRHNPGTIRFSNDEFSYMTTGWDDGRSFEPMDASYLQAMRRAAIEAAGFRNADLVLDNTNLSPATRQEVCRILGDNADIITIDFKVTATECVRRNEARGCPVPNRVIHQMAAQWAYLYEWV